MMNAPHEERVDLPLTPEQAAALREGLPLDRLARGEFTESSMHLAEDASGRPILSLRFTPRPALTLLTAAAVATTLGVTRKTVYKLARENAFPTYRIAGQHRFRLEEIAAYVERCIEGQAPSRDESDTP